MKESTAFILRLQAVENGQLMLKTMNSPWLSESVFKGGVREQASGYVISSCRVLIDWHQGEVLASLNLLVSTLSESLCFSQNSI